MRRNKKTDSKKKKTKNAIDIGNKEHRTELESKAQSGIFFLNFHFKSKYHEQCTSHATYSNSNSMHALTSTLGEIIH